MADEEQAYLGAMKATNGVAETYEGNGEASEQQAESSSSDEYDPSQAVPTETSPLASREPAFQISHEYSMPSTLHAVAAVSSTPNVASANPLLEDTVISDRQSQSRSMSRDTDTSQLIENNIVVTNPQRTSEVLANTERSGKVGQLGGSGALDVNEASSIDPVSSSNLKPSTNHVSADNIPIQNDVQDKSTSEVVQKSATDTVSNLAAVIPDSGASSHSDPTAKPTETLPAPKVTESRPHAKQQPATPTIPAPRARLPHDKIGILEDRIKEDTRGDMDAWLSLINEHRKRAKLDDARSVYERFFGVFPAAAEQWVAYAQMENEAQNRNAMEKVFQRTLMQLPHLQLWSLYLDHVRRYNNLTIDASGQARQVINQAYDLALHQIGLDKESGRLWQDYVQFIKSGPGAIGGSNWQDQQKMDQLRKTYQRAICIPTQSTNVLWKEYDGFEMNLNKMTGRKFLQDQSPAYMSARSSYTELQNITRKLRRTTLPVLPPAPGFDGDVEYMEQLDIWKRWIQWEKDDPLVLKQEDIAAYRARILFVYKQALMAMRFWPELWCDASDFCFLNDLESEGNEFLTQGITANPESCLLAFKRADRIELSTANEEGDESAIRRGAAVREPYDKVLDALYDLITKSKLRESQELTRIEAQFDDDGNYQPNGNAGDDEIEGMDEEEESGKEKRKAIKVDAVKNMYAVQISLLSKTLSHVWIAVIRAMRRIQGKGQVNNPMGGERQAFADARKRGRLTSDVYVAAALIEFHCYEAETGRKIFERGLRLFPEDEIFALDYIKHLVANNDHINARVVFETAVTKMSQKPETLSKAKPLYAFFHDFESRYGELTQIVKLEQRMRDLFPEDPALVLFSQRFAEQSFDPTAIRPIVSPATQARPKVIRSIETDLAAQDATLERVNQTLNSPKRPLPLDELDDEAGPPRKYARGESPLKGAAGRRLDQQKRNRQPNDMPQFDSHPVPQPQPPPPLPRDVMFLLSIIPKAETYHATKFKAEEIVRLIRETNIPRHISQIQPPPSATPGNPPIQHPPFQQMPQVSQNPPYGQFNGQYNGGHLQSSSASYFPQFSPGSPPDKMAWNSLVVGHDPRLALNVHYPDHVIVHSRPPFPNMTAMATLRRPPTRNP